MNRIACLSVVVGLAAAGAFLPLLAQQNPGSQKTSPQVTPSPQMSRSTMQTSQLPAAPLQPSPMSVSDMVTHMNGTMSHLQGIPPAAQGNPVMQALLDRTKVLGADLRQLMDGMQSAINQMSVNQDKLKQQHLQNLSKQVQTIMLTMDSMVTELELMQKNK